MQDAIDAVLTVQPQPELAQAQKLLRELLGQAFVDRAWEWAKMRETHQHSFAYLEKKVGEKVKRRDEASSSSSSAAAAAAPAAAARQGATRPLPPWLTTVHQQRQQQQQHAAAHAGGGGGGTGAVPIMVGTMGSWRRTSTRRRRTRTRTSWVRVNACFVRCAVCRTLD